MNIVTNLINKFIKSKENQIESKNINLPTEPLNVIKTLDGNFKTEGIIDIKDNSNGSLRTFIGNLSTLQNNKDVISNSNYTYNYRILEQFLENAYQQSWIAKKIVELPVEMAMLNGFEINLKNKNDEKKFWDAWEKFELNSLIIDTQKWADVYGSSVILFKNKNQDPEKPFTNFKNLEFLQVQYPFYMPLPKSDDVYETDRISFNLLGFTAPLENVAVFYGTKCIKRLSPQFKYFGMSVYQNIWKAMISDDLITTAIPNLVYRSSNPVYKMKGFNKLIEVGKHGLLLDTISIADQAAGIFGVRVIDQDDEFLLISQSFSNLDKLDIRSAERLCASIGYTATLILGKSPDGQNSTGKHDERNNLLATKRYQNKMLPTVRKIAMALLDHLEIDKTDVEFNFANPDIQDSEQMGKINNIELDNAIKMQQLLNNQEIVNRYLKEKGIINEDEFNDLKNLQAEFDENIQFENEKRDI